MKHILEQIAKSKSTDYELLIQLVRHIRPNSSRNVTKTNEKIQELISILQEDENLTIGFRSYIYKLFKERRFSSFITEIGIQSERGFWDEIRKRIYNKILPLQSNTNSLDFILTNVFYHRNDYKWFRSISKEDWETLFQILQINPLNEKKNDSFIVSEIFFAIEILALKISSSAMDLSILKMVPELRNLHSPYISLQKEISDLIFNISKNNEPRDPENQILKQIKILVKQCNNYILIAIKNKDKYGISFVTTTKLTRQQQQLERLVSLLDFLFEKPKIETEKYTPTIIFFNQIIKLNSVKNDILPFWKKSTNLVAYQITQHSGKTGEHYITSNKKEYYEMLKAAAGGGVVVGILCFFKLYYSTIDTSPFGKAFLYSLNYALGFIAIYLMHFTLATKQPAMTAATLAQAIETKSKYQKLDYSKFTLLFTKLFRSQFIAFVGNVLFAFPVAIGFTMFLQWVFGMEQFVGQDKTAKLLQDLNIFESKAIFHAGVAGFYLFISGLISGYFVNRNIHENISLRIKMHPFLRLFLSNRILEKIHVLYNKYIGGITGNMWLGILLGTTGTIALFFGLDIDIRHITFAAGNFGLALLGSGFNLGIGEILISIIGIGIIGFMNFIVSFTFSLIVALRSRNKHIKELVPLFQSIWQHFKSRKRDFFIPPNQSLLAENPKSESL
jgi:site-specific recombinase